MQLFAFGHQWKRQVPPLCCNIVNVLDTTNISFSVTIKKRARKNKTSLPYIEKIDDIFEFKCLFDL